VSLIRFGASGDAGSSSIGRKAMVHGSHAGKELLVQIICYLSKLLPLGFPTGGF
jgi:hypothetical protein